MKNIGLKLKEKRIQNGLSIDEVAEDLKLRPSQIESIEEGKQSLEISKRLNEFGYNTKSIKGGLNALK